MRRDGFDLRESRGLRYYSCKAFEDIPLLRHGFSTRDSESGSDARPLDPSHRLPETDERFLQNRERFLSALGLRDARLATLRQVHSNRAHIIEDLAGEWNPPEGDALITARSDIALAVKVADCLPILIADPVRRVVAAVHSGWRGTLAGILPHTISEMRRSFGCSPSNLLVAVGPGIRECCFEVGPEVVVLFEREYPGSRLTAPVAGRPGKSLLDMVAALEIQMEAAGVPPENRYDLGACTRCHPERFFSYRAEGTSTGRMLAVIGLA